MRTSPVWPGPVVSHRPGVVGQSSGLSARHSDCFGLYSASVGQRRIPRAVWLYLSLTFAVIGVSGLFMTGTARQISASVGLALSIGGVFLVGRVAARRFRND